MKITLDTKVMPIYNWSYLPNKYNNSSKHLFRNECNTCGNDVENCGCWDLEDDE